MERASELEWLQWFYSTCDFGPAHEDVIMLLQKKFTEETGKAIPEGYEYE